MIRTSQILNSALVESIARLGHGQRLVVADAGLPCPRDIPVIDLAVLPGLPSFTPVVEAILLEGFFETAIVAEESATNPAFGTLARHLSTLDTRTVSHEQFKGELADAAVIVRTGECTPYANIALVAGVSF